MNLQECRCEVPNGHEKKLKLREVVEEDGVDTKVEGFLASGAIRFFLVLARVFHRKSTRTCAFSWPPEVAGGLGEGRAPGNVMRVPIAARCGRLARGWENLLASHKQRLASKASGSKKGSDPTLPGVSFRGSPMAGRSLLWEARFVLMCVLFAYGYHLELQELFKSCPLRSGGLRSGVLRLERAPGGVHG